MFCTKECYEDYKKDFVVEIYNDTPIYCIEINGKKRYMPLLEAWRKQKHYIAVYMVIIE